MKFDIRLLLFDMDGTLIRNPHSGFNSSWDAVGMAADVWKEFEDNKARYYDLKDQWHLWAQADADLLKGKSFEEVRRKTLEIISYAPGLEALFTELNGRYRAGILSNGVGFVADEIAGQFGFDLELCLADRLLVEEGYFTGEVVPGMPKRDKTEGLKYICKKAGVSPDQICYVGDHLNDLAVFKEVECSVFMDNGNKDPCLEKARIAARGNSITDFRELIEYIR